MTHIIESIHKNGIVHTPWDRVRGYTPRSGDFVRWPAGLINPTYHRIPGGEPSTPPLGRIWECGYGYCDAHQAQVCESPGSAFLLDDGTVDISGGPFRIIAIEDLEPTLELHVGVFWNWGNHMPSAGKGVEYHIARPIFEYHPTGTS